MKNKQMITYKNNIFYRLVEWVKKIFHINKNEKIINETKQLMENILNDEKEQMMQKYNAVKKGAIDIYTLTKEEQYKIMLLLNEEMELQKKNTFEKLKELDMRIYTLKLNIKELEKKRKQ